MSIPRRQRKRATVCAHGEPGTSSAIVACKCVTAHEQRVDRAQIVGERDLRAAVGELDAAEPVAVTGRPGIGRAVIAHVVTQQQLAQPVPRSHQITAHILARAHQVTQRLLLYRSGP